MPYYYNILIPLPLHAATIFGGTGGFAWCVE
jgi:hypothetical protein